MNLFYNPEGVGDVAFLQLEPVTGPVNYDKKGNVVTLYQKIKLSALISLKLVKRVLKATDILS